MANGSARSIWRVGLVVGVFGLAHAAAADPLQPHRAVYDVSLQASDPSVSLVSGTGRLVLEITGSICDGFSTTMRDVTRVTDREGTVQTTDQRVSSYETMDPPTFSFVNEIEVDGETQSSLRGEATARASGISVAAVARRRRRGRAGVGGAALSGR